MKKLCCFSGCEKEPTHVVNPNHHGRWSFACEEHIEDLKDLDDDEVITIGEWESR